MRRSRSCSVRSIATSSGRTPLLLTVPAPPVALSDQPSQGIQHKKPSIDLLHHIVRDLPPGCPTFLIGLFGCPLKFLGQLELSLDLFMVRSQFLAEYEYVGFGLPPPGHV